MSFSGGKITILKNPSNIGIMIKCLNKASSLNYNVMVVYT